MTTVNKTSAQVLAEKNQEWWDSKASTYDIPKWMSIGIQKISEELLRPSAIKMPWEQSSTGKADRLLDYASGGGHQSRAFAPSVNHIRGIDLSEKMVAKYNQEAVGDMVAVQGNILTGMDDESNKALREVKPEELTGFDVVLCSMALHHIEDPLLLIKKLLERTKQGGVLVLVDLTGPEFPPEYRQADGSGDEQGKTRSHEAAGHHHHQHDHPGGPTFEVHETIAHQHGFTAEKMKEYFTEAGCVETEYVVSREAIHIGADDGQLKHFFVAKARMP